MMRGRASTDEQQAFRSSVRAFLTEHVVPHVAEWEAAKCVPKSLYAEFGRLGVTGIRIPEQFGGAGETSFIYNVIFGEEVMRTGAVSGALQLHLNVVLPLRSGPPCRAVTRQICLSASEIEASVILRR